jgi:hypothetical protein
VSAPIEDGWAAIPEIPGLGPEPDADLLARFRV